MKRLCKVYIGAVVLALMCCFTCVTVLAVNDECMLVGHICEYWDYNGWHNDDKVGLYSLVTNPYAIFNIDLTWYDDNNSQFRPSGKLIWKAVADDEKACFDIVYSTDTGVFGGPRTTNSMWSETSCNIYKGTCSERKYSGAEYYPNIMDCYLAQPAESRDEIINLLMEDYNTPDEVDSAIKAAYGAESYCIFRDYALDLCEVDWYHVSESESLDKTFYRSSVGAVIYPFKVAYKLAPVVKFTDGVEDEEIFEDYTTDLNENGDYLYLHDSTPQFESKTRSTIPQRDGYRFVGWKLTTGEDKDTDSPGGIRDTVEVSQMDDIPVVIYEAVWAEGAEEPPKLSITKTASKQVVAPGDEVVYTVTVSNIGGSTSSGVVVEDILDNRLIFKSCQIGDGAVNSSEPSGGIYELGSLDSGQSIVLLITVQVADGTPDGSIRNVAVATRD